MTAVPARLPDHRIGSAPRRARLYAHSELLACGLRAMLAPYGDRWLLETGDHALCDVTLFEADDDEAGHDLVASLQFQVAPRPVVLCPWPGVALTRSALAAGARGVLSPLVASGQLVDALTRVARGERLVQPSAARPVEVTCRGASGLSDRETQVLCLVAAGLSNEEIASFAYLSVNTVKSYIRSAYRKIGVTRRVDAVRWMRTAAPRSGG